MSDPIADLLAAQAKSGTQADPVGAMLADQAKAKISPVHTQIDPSEGGTNLRPFGIDTGIKMPQGVTRFLAGAGKGISDMNQGVGQLIRSGAESIGAKDFADKLGLPRRSDVDYAKQLDNSLMNTGTGTTGHITGTLAATAPTFFAGPGAATIGGGMMLGAGMGALQPVGTKESRVDNMTAGAVAGGVIPTAIRAGKVAKAALIDPFTEAGRTRILGNVLNKSAADPAAAAANMQGATGQTPGFNPTAGQASGDAGIASVERTARAIDPAGFGDVDKAQRSALASALQRIAKTPEERAAAVTARDQAVKPLYEEAKKAVVPSDAEIADLLKRPSMAAAQQRAAGIASERGDQFAIKAGTPEKTVESGLLDASGFPITRTVPATPGTLQGNALHDLKMGLDDAIGSPGTGGMQGAERDAAVKTKEAYLAWLENKIPAYGDAKNTYSSMSKPINQIDVGQELYNRLVPALAGGEGAPFKLSADSFARALRNGDQLTRTVTGQKGATFAGTMAPEQLGALQGVAKDAQMRAAAETSGRGVGSDTVQKMAMSNLIDQAGLPTWVSAMAPLRSVGGMVKTAGDILYTKNDETMRHLLADVLKDPQRAAMSMGKANVTPSKYLDWLRATGQATGVSALPLLTNGGQQ